MSQFCHDQYDHPLLWCDGKRRIVQQQDALLAMATVNELKEQDRQKRIDEQREYRDMISKHCPWGRPGGGAPGDHLRRGNVLAQGIFPVTRPDCRQYTLVDYGKTGRNNPNASSTFHRLDTGREANVFQSNHQKRNSLAAQSGHIGQPAGQQLATMKLSDNAHNTQRRKPNKQKRKTVLPPMQCCCSKCCCNCGLTFDTEQGARDTESLKPFSPEGRGHHRQVMAKKISAGLESAPLLSRRRAVAEQAQTEFEPIEGDHLSELCRQIKQKERREEIRQVVERHLSDKHFATLDSMWGRPGNGAPRPIKNKLNLDDLLYKVPFKADYVL